MNSIKRSRVLIDPKVQWALAIRMLLHWTLLVVSLLMINSLMSLLMMAGDKPLTGAVGESLRQQTPLMVVMVVLVPVFLWDTMKLSNRFAGPMYRFRTGLSELATVGTTQPIKLRDGDFWGIAATDFNAVLTRVEKLQAENVRLKSRVEALQLAVDDSAVTIGD